MQVPLPDGHRYEILKRSGIPALIEGIREWHPDIAVGGGRCYLRADLYARHVHLDGEAEKDVFVGVFKVGDELADMRRRKRGRPEPALQRTRPNEVQRMRTVVILVLPLLAQDFAYIVVFLAARGGGCFMGLLAMPVAAVSVVAPLVDAIASVRRGGAVLRPTVVGLAVALLPPIGLLIVRALES